jgi:hypothetical protein
MCPRFLIFCIKILNVRHIFHVQYCTANYAELTQNNTVFGNKSTERSHSIWMMCHWKSLKIQACHLRRSRDAFSERKNLQQLWCIFPCKHISRANSYKQTTKAHFVTILVINIEKCLIKFGTNQHVPKTLNEQEMQQAPDKDALSTVLMLKAESWHDKFSSFWTHIISNFAQSFFFKKSSVRIQRDRTVYRYTSNKRAFISPFSKYCGQRTWFGRSGFQLEHSC